MSNQGPEAAKPEHKEVSLKKLIELSRNRLFKRLIDLPEVPNQQHHVQALKDKLRESYAQGEELRPEDKSRLELRAKAQASNLMKAESLDYSFAEKKALYESFINVIRSKLVEQKITAETVKATLLALQGQFEIKAKARGLAVTVTAQIEQTKLDIARLERELAEKPVESSSSSPSKPPLDYLAIAKSALEAQRRDLQEAKMMAEKATDIDMQYRDAFITFVSHALKPSILPIIVDEVHFAKPDQHLTQDDIDAAMEPWKAIAEGRAARLADVEKNGGKFAGIQARVADWYNIMPKAQSSEEMSLREKIHPYTAEEEKSLRDERIRLISGLPFRREQLDAKAVARDKGSRKKQIAAPVAKQLHELNDEHRREFEKLGIKPYPKNQQSVIGAIYRTATGSECRNTEFEDKPTPKSPNPPRRVMLDEGAPLLFPERKQLATKTLSPLLDRHLQLGANKGYLVGQKTKQSDEYRKASDDEALDAVMQTLSKLKI